MNRPPLAAASLLMLLILLAVRLPSVHAHQIANRHALYAVQTCFSHSTNALPPRRLEPTFAAALARCQNQPDRARQAWQSELAHSSARLPLARAARPHDLTLAQFAAAGYPDQAQAHLWLGDALVHDGQTSAAITAYEHGLALDSTDGLAWRVLGDLYRDQDDKPSAVRAYDQACFRVDRGKNGCPRAGGIYMQQGRYDLAADRYRRSLQQLPGYHPAQRGLAAALLAMGQTAEARPYLESLAAAGDDWARQQLETLTIDDRR